MFKRDPDQPPKDSFSTSHPPLSNMTDQSPTASIYDYPSRAVSPWHASDEDSQLPDLDYPPTPPLSLTYPSRLPSPVIDQIGRLLPNARLRERYHQASVHAAMVATVPDAMGFPLAEAIRGFATRSPRLARPPLPRQASPTPLPRPPLPRPTSLVPAAVIIVDDIAGPPSTRYSVPHGGRHPPPRANSDSPWTTGLSSRFSPLLRTTLPDTRTTCS
jgi:hypothetical protein